MPSTPIEHWIVSILILSIPFARLVEISAGRGRWCSPYAWLGRALQEFAIWSGTGLFLMCARCTDGLGHPVCLGGACTFAYDTFSTIRMVIHRRTIQRDLEEGRLGPLTY